MTGLFSFRRLKTLIQGILSLLTLAGCSLDAKLLSGLGLTSTLQNADPIVVNDPMKLVPEGAKGQDFTYTILKGEGTVDENEGVFVPSAPGSVMVMVRDAAGNTRIVIFDVKDYLLIPNQVYSLVNSNYSIPVAGGIPPYHFEIVSGSGDIQSSGVFTSPVTSGISTVKVHDNANHAAQIAIVTYDILEVSPTQVTLAQLNNFSFSASGGVPPYTYTVESGFGLILPGGFYTAPVVTSSETLVVTDHIGNKARASVTVTEPLQIQPSSRALAIGNSFAFTAKGGVGGNKFLFVNNQSGGTLNPDTGEYVVGTQSGVVDTIKVVDAYGNISNATITVNASLQINPATISLAVYNVVPFFATGGAGGNEFSLQSNNSGATLDSVTGEYQAGPVSGVSDVIKVTDSLGNTSLATVTVNAALTLSPASGSVAIGNDLSFSSTGGVGVKVYSFVNNNSGGTLNSSTGAYRAGSTANVSDTIKVTDAYGNSVAATIEVQPALTLTSTLQNLAVSNSTDLVSAGGVGAKSYSFVTNNSGGSVDSVSGAYVAGTVGGVTDTLKVTDSLGNTATTAITVQQALKISPATVSMAISTSRAFSGSGGVAPYAFSIVSGGGSINSTTGSYTAPATAQVVTVKVQDSLGNSAQAVLNIITQVDINITENTLSLDVAAAAGNPAAGIPIVVNVPAGVIVGSNSVLTPSLDLSNVAPGTTVTINNAGYIVGRGGDPRLLDGGVDPVAEIRSGQGGDAIRGKTGVAIQIHNTGVIGGGGGGGTGIFYNWGLQSAVGGGGAGHTAGPMFPFEYEAGSIEGCGPSAIELNATGGSLLTGGTGSQALIAQTCMPNTRFYGGAGGSLGQRGGSIRSTTNSDWSATQPIYGGGAPGKAVNLNGSTITWQAGDDAAHVKGAVN